MEYIVQQPAKKKTSSWVVILFFVVVILLGFNYLASFFTDKGVPKQELVSTNYNSTISVFHNVTYTGILPQLPSSLPTASVTKVSGDTAQFEAKLFSVYDFKPVPQAPNVWQNNDYSLVKIPDPLTYVMSRETSPIKAQKGIILSDAIATARTTVATLLPNEKIEPMSSAVQFYTVWEDGHPDVASQSEANAVEIPFGYQYGPYPVLYNTNYSYPVSIIVTNDGKIGKITAQPFILEFTPQKNFATLSLAEALKAIEVGDGSIVYQNYVGSGTPSLENILSAAFSSVTVEYRVDDTTTLLVPYYRFKGILTNSENVDFDAEVITPAIPIKR